MSYFPFVADENEVPALQAIKDSFGFVPNFYRAQTMRPDLIDVEERLVNAILVKEGALTRQQKEYIFLVCSAANLSTYCLTAHCEIVRMMGIEGPEPEQIALDHTAAKIPIPIKALLNFAAKLNNQPAKITKRDVDVLHTYGYTDQQIMEAVLTVGLAKFANFVAFGLGTSPDFDPSKAILAQLGPAAGSAR
jgi:uncharacterized peroxidase-related enzyme